MSPATQEREGPARVGPNAVLQTAAALRAEGGEALARQVFEAAGLARLLEAPPEAMVPEIEAARLHRVVAACLPAGRAERVAAEAGRLTAEYLLAHRIPKPAQRLLRALPPRLAGRLLLTAISRAAWTFAGSGGFSFRGWGRPVVEIAANPLATPGCPWHRAVFERLFRALVAPGTRVVETACCARGAPACRYEIALRPAPGAARALPARGEA